MLLPACSGPPPLPAPPPLLMLTIKAGADQNPDGDGHAAPVAIRLFMLNATARFERADAIALIDREQAVLGDEAAGTEELVIRPGETRSIEREPKKGVRALGVAVIFRDIDRAAWRVAAPVAASGPTKLVLTTSGTATALVPG